MPEIEIRKPGRPRKEVQETPQAPNPEPTHQEPAKPRAATSVGSRWRLTNNGWECA